MALSPRVAALLAAVDTTRIAVVGASNDGRKFGNRILLDLLGKGYAVLPVNPTENAVAGQRAYRSIADIPGPVHIVDFVVPPPVALKVLDGLPDGIEVVWFQPGSYDGRVVERARARFPEVVAGACIMVEAPGRSGA